MLIPIIRTESAKEEIFITAWFLSPKLYLKRAKPIDEADRLDNILFAKAKEGVPVYILVWDEIDLGGDQVVIYFF